MTKITRKEVPLKYEYIYAFILKAGKPNMYSRRKVSTIEVWKWKELQALERFFTGGYKKLSPLTKY